MPLRFDQPQPDDLPIDWPMILTGWRGFARRKLSAEQVIAHALEQIGRGTLEQDELAALLANTDPGEWQTIDRYVGQLAGTECSDKELALRKWRLVELKYLLNDLHQSDDSSDEDEDKWYSVESNLTDFWLAYNE